MIEIEDVTKIFGIGAAVNTVSFSVARGELVVIVGTSGSGKTTLMRMINRLVEPTSGTIRIDGRENHAVPPHELRRGIGYAIQGNGLFPHRTVAENIATVPRLLGWDKRRIAARVDELLTLFHLDPKTYAHRMPHQLSGGQQQRIGVARALAAGPSVLLMDEPFGALDPIIRASAQDDLRAIQRSLGTTVVLVTHDMEEAIHLGDKIAVMDHGKLLQFATPRDILARPATSFVEALLGKNDRAYRLLSLSDVESLVEPGEAEGAAVAASSSLRDALSDILWAGRAMAPVQKDGRIIGRITRDALFAHAARPQ